MRKKSIFEVKCAERGDIFIYLDGELVHSPFGAGPEAEQRIKDQRIVRVIRGGSQIEILFALRDVAMVADAWQSQFEHYRNSLFWSARG